ncbi:hypothetical protein [Micromonospora sagamiensis]|uniref:Uncharacterized protein n=1 Tax=Micromonospora sagamiensis TaxID=47875 RepID=A0A562WGF5_9ACTN|nr:hypothetical protein [Micromonospora sagamiensis]TWJ28644.1 hypothetical protein JD81_02149 [Micromonospora sagamiensis]BCL12451.1 hypothetical protein GCM10017556_01900 [Micromonospora sagamiensis]
MDRAQILARSLLPAAIMATLPLLATVPAAQHRLSPDPVGRTREFADQPPLADVPAAPAPPGPELLAKATPDECFAGIGEPYPPGPPCRVGVPKVNQSYVWGLTKSGDQLWFGTAPNVHCLTLGKGLKQTKPVQNDDYVCEYGESQLRKLNPFLPAGGGDWRPPDVFLYDTRTRQLTDKGGDIGKASPMDRMRRNSTIGIRAAGSHQGVVLLGGPALGGINLFAFDSESGRYLGSTTLSDYGNIRNFVVADGVLYAGVGVGLDGLGGGAVLRWTGSKDDPFRFGVVGDLPGQVADITAHQGRIALITWPSAGTQGRVPGVWLSPLLADGEPGLTPADADGWSRLWDAGQYEPDPVVAETYGLGGLASYGGHLYWGTMHVPLKATQAHARRYTPTGGKPDPVAVPNTQRTASLFRAGGFDPECECEDNASVELLYGQSKLPAFDPAANDGAGEWRLTPTGYTPRFGAAGFGNGYNNYIWKMVVAGGSLYVGTMDWSYLGRESGGGITAALGTADASSYGADLWAFDNPNEPARPVDTTGLGNYLNYGIRTMVADDSSIYLGMANPMNLRTDEQDDVPEGGWELIRLPVAALDPSTAGTGRPLPPGGDASEAAATGGK